MTSIATDRITFGEARRMLACGPAALAKLLKGGRLAVQRLPGSHPKLSRREVEALAAEFTVRAAAPAVA